jgi:hypothetical protein
MNDHFNKTLVKHSEDGNAEPTHRQRAFLVSMSEWLNATSEKHRYTYFNSITPTLRVWMGKHLGQHVRTWLSKQHFGHVDEEEYTAMVESQTEFRAKRKPRQNESGRIGDWVAMMQQTKTRPTGAMDLDDTMRINYKENTERTAGHHHEKKWHKKMGKMKAKFHMWLERQNRKTQPGRQLINKPLSIPHRRPRVITSTEVPLTRAEMIKLNRDRVYTDGTPWGMDQRTDKSLSFREKGTKQTIKDLGHNMLTGMYNIRYN